jgi:hypothetical protein
VESDDARRENWAAYAFFKVEPGDFHNFIGSNSQELKQSEFTFHK